MLPNTDPATSRNRLRTGERVALVLGSGGARGLAHIGVIEALQTYGYTIAAISGTSMGAVIGALHAIDQLTTYRDWVVTLSQSDVIRLLDWSLTGTGGGFIRGHKLMQHLRSLVGDARIEELPVPYTAVTVDIDRSQEVWLTDGPLYDALRATIGIPGVFAPHLYRGRRLVDGGLLDPVPVAPTLRSLTDCTVVVDLNAGSDPDQAAANGDSGSAETGWFDRLRGYAEDMGLFSAGSPQPPLHDQLAVSEVLLRSIDTMQTALTRHHLAVFQPDLAIRIPKDSAMIHEFHRARELIDLGRRLTETQLQSLGRHPVTPGERN